MPHSVVNVCHMIRGVGKGDKGEMSHSEIVTLKNFLSEQYEICDIQ